VEAKIVWRKVKGEGKMRFLRLPIPPFERRAGGPKYIYVALDPSYMEPVMRARGYDNWLQALTYHRARVLGWSEEVAEAFARSVSR
jgi:hypothetical protein